VYHHGFEQTYLRLTFYCLLGFKLEPFFATAQAASKNDAPFKSDQERLKNNHLAS